MLIVRWCSSASAGCSPLAAHQSPIAVHASSQFTARPGRPRSCGTLAAMAMKAEDLWREALALTDDERADLAAELLASLEEQTEDDAEVVRVVWAEEIEHRARMVIAGESATEPWETVRQRIVDELAG